MLYIADVFVALLTPFLVLSAMALAGMLAFLALQRGVDEWQFRFRQRTAAHYRDTIDVLLGPGDADSALIMLAKANPSRRPVIESMILKPLALATGSVVERLRRAARVLGFVDGWAARLNDRRWWNRAEAARALGLVREPRAVGALLRALDDDHDEVRAAAVEALGLIGNAQAIPVLLARLPEQSRHQRARIVEALREFGDAATPQLITHARTHPADAALMVDILGLIGGTAAVEALELWGQDSRPEVRDAAFRGLGTIGLDPVGVRLAQHALDDDEIPVRASAARALGRAGSLDAAAGLARHLDDDWVVAASCADALRRLGRVGLAFLQARTHETGYVGDLARQMVWERRKGST